MVISGNQQRSQWAAMAARTLRVAPALLAMVFSTSACSNTGNNDAFGVTQVAKFEQPWAMAFLPDGRLLVTEKRGALMLVSQDGSSIEVAGIPEVNFGGQGGLGDVVLHPAYADNGLVYISYAEQGEGGSGAAVARGRLELHEGSATLAGLELVWRQAPKMSGQGHYGHRIAFGPEGYLWISSGDRQKFDPAQDMQGNLGKILRLNDDGTVPADNPFAAQGGVTAQIWSLGHRNPLGLAFDDSGQLWVVEMGPKHGDELNLVAKGANYGYPIVSDGDHYDGTEIPDHATRPEFEAPALVWTPAISPSSMIFYGGGQFPQWRGDALISGLSSKSLVRVEVDGKTASEAQRFDLGERIRAVAEAPDGAIWLLQDGKNAGAGHLLKLTAPDPSAPG